MVGEAIVLRFALEFRVALLLGRIMNIRDTGYMYVLLGGRRRIT